MSLPILRGKEQWFNGIFSRKKIEKIISGHLLYDGSNVELISRDGFVVGKSIDDDINDDADSTAGNSGDQIPKREIHSGELWQHFKGGGTVRILTPALYNDTIWKLLSAMEFEFQTMMGGVAALAPPDAVVNAPRYDSHNMFVLQLEGYSRWRLMHTATPSDAGTSTGKATGTQSDGSIFPALPRESGYVDVAYVNNWKSPAITDILLSPGDSLYVPRGCIYQQDSIGPAYLDTVDTSSGVDPQVRQRMLQGSSHSLSLHIICGGEGAFSNTAQERQDPTASTGCNSIADLLELAVPQALAEVIQQEPSFRQLLPQRCDELLGVAVSEIDDDERRTALREQLRACWIRLWIMLWMFWIQQQIRYTPIYYYHVPLSL